jgi:hypothetical protein
MCSSMTVLMAQARSCERKCVKNMCMLSCARFPPLTAGYVPPGRGVLALSRLRAFLLLTCLAPLRFAWPVGTACRSSPMTWTMAWEKQRYAFWASSN